eukprot:scaffold18107_cov57-Phaeocystis_antarctica.AAC.3
MERTILSCVSSGNALERPLGLEPDHVRAALGEALDLGEERGAVARPRALAAAALVRGELVRVLEHDVVRPLPLRLGDGAALVEVRERQRWHLARLRLELAPRDRPAVEAGRRPSLQPTERQLQPRERLGERRGGRLLLARLEAAVAVEAAGGARGAADVDDAAQESARRDHDALGAHLLPCLGAHARHAAAAVLKQQVVDRRLDDGEVGHLEQRAQHRGAVQVAVRLRARPLHRRPLASVQHAEMDAGLVDHAAHQTVEGVDLAHEVALADAADRRVAR